MIKWKRKLEEIKKKEEIFSVGSSVERHVAFPHIRPWVIHFYKNIRGRGLKATVGVQESDEVVLPAESSSSQSDGGKPTKTGLGSKELSPLSQPASSSSDTQSSRQPDVDKVEELITVEGATKVKTSKPQSTTKQTDGASPRPLSTYEKVRVLCWPWRKPEGLINRPVLQMLLECLLYCIMANPGISDKSLYTKYSVCLQPRTVLELLRILQDLRCIRKSIFRLSHKATLFSKPATLTKVSENSKPEDVDQTVYDATMTSTVLLGQFMSQL